MPDFNTMTKAGIADWAGRRGLELPMTMTKAAMVAAAEAHDRAPAAVRHVITTRHASPVILSVDGKVHDLPARTPLELSPAVRAALADAGITFEVAE